MSDVLKGMLAGGVATAALSLVMLLFSVLGFEPQLELTRLLLVLVDAPTEYALGWILHWMIGSVVLGGLFAHFEPRLGAATHVKNGILFGVAVWLVVMLFFMPAVGAGYFGFQVSLFAPLIMLGLQVFHSGVMGWVYGKLSPHNSLTKHHPA